VGDSLVVRKSVYPANWRYLRTTYTFTGSSSTIMMRADDGTGREVPAAVVASGK
jgi:hypothetical protein